MEVAIEIPAVWLPVVVIHQWKVQREAVAQVTLPRACIDLESLLLEFLQQRLRADASWAARNQLQHGQVVKQGIANPWHDF